MRSYRIESKEFLKEFPPKGALHCEGRWNRLGTWVVYTSESIALAKLEVLANSGAALPMDVYLRTFEIKDDAPFIQLKVTDLPDDWHQVPYPALLSELVEDIKSSNEYLGCVVPSAQSFTENNILLFGDHPTFKESVKELEAVLEIFDERLRKK